MVLFQGTNNGRNDSDVYGRMKYKQSKNKYDKRSRSFEDKKDDELYNRIKNNTYNKNKSNKCSMYNERWTVNQVTARQTRRLKVVQKLNLQKETIKNKSTFQIFKNKTNKHIWIFWKLRGHISELPIINFSH